MLIKKKTVNKLKYFIEGSLWVVNNGIKKESSVNQQ